MSISQHVHVTICSPFRDSGADIPAYFERLFTLRLDNPYVMLRFVYVEGDSKDSTWEMLREWAQYDDRVTLVKCDTGKPRYGPVVNPERFQVLARVFNEALDAVDLEWTDYVLFLPSDIHYEPDLLSRLLAADKDIVAPFSWTYENGRYRFYDVWGFGCQGKAFTPFTQQAAREVYGDALLQMDMVGGTVLIKSAVLKLGCRYTEKDVDRGLCWDAQRLGFTVWADPATAVYHPPLAKERPESQGLARYIGHDAQTVRKAIHEKYRFDCGEQYAADFVAFVEGLTRGQ